MYNPSLEVIVLNYNLDLFGEKMREIRVNLDLTQKRISELTGIDSVTIRRIENGKVIPKLETLELLSPIYKMDLINLLLKYRFDDYSLFLDIKNRIEFKLDSADFDTLNLELKELNVLLSSTNNSYYKVIIKQLILFVEAIALYKNNRGKYSEALNMLIKSIRMTTSSFDLDNYNSYVYSSTELRILMNIAFLLNKLNYYEKYIEIMEFCFKSADPSDDIYPKLCHNLSGALNRKKEYVKALHVSNMGIEACQKTRNLNGLNILYYGKAIVEFQLGNPEYIKSLDIALTLCEALGQDKLKNEIILNFKEAFGVDL